MDAKVQEVFDRLEKLSHKKCANLAEKMADYTLLAPTFDEDCAALQYSAPHHAVKALNDAVGADANCNKADLSVIDFAAGTGLVCKALHELGFQGAIDAQDGSDAMLEIGAPLYRRSFCCILEEGATLPDKLCGGAYDAAILCGGFSQSQVEVECVTFMIDAVRIGGYTVFTTRLNPSNVEFANRLDKKCSELEARGRWRLVSRLHVDEFELATSEKERSQNSIFIPGVVFCYQKTS